VSIAARGLALALLAALVFCSDRPFRGNNSFSPAHIVKVLTVMNARAPPDAVMHGLKQRERVGCDGEECG
jgi:hypothetical protein